MPDSVEQLIEYLTIWELSDVHDVKLNIEASLEPSGFGYKRKHIDNNEGSNKDNRRKVQVRSVHTTLNAGLRLWG